MPEDTNHEHGGEMDLHAHLLHMLGAQDHEDAARIIGELHAAQIKPEAVQVPLCVRTAPERIWLQISDDKCHLDEEFPHGFEVTWCEDSVMDCEVEYVRADLVAPQPPDQAEARGDEPVVWREAVATAYGYLWHVNNEPAAPIPMYSPEKAAYEARRALRDLLTSGQRGEAINKVGLQLGVYSDEEARPAPAAPQAGEAPSVEAAREMGAKGAPAVEAERLAFEAWMAGHCWALSATWDGKQYKSDAEAGGDLDPRAMATRRLWAAWRDRAALTSQPMSREGMNEGVEGPATGLMHVIEGYAKATRAGDRGACMALRQVLQEGTEQMADARGIGSGN